MKALKIEIGQCFGRLVVIERVGSKKKHVFWKCRCDCGNDKILRGTNLRSGTTLSCGCRQQENWASRIKNETGHRFGRLVVIGFAKRHNGRALWKCRCDCGTMKIICAGDLRSANTKSCGCLKSEQASARGKAKRRHGHTLHGKPSPTYVTWRSMRVRCHDLSNKKFHLYGGRGIRVCARWFTFENFLADMGERPPDKTLDRIDNDGHYIPSNCRWATRKEQRANRRVKKSVA